jgi:hypothetical protein
MKKRRPLLTIASLLVLGAATVSAQTPFQLGPNTFDDATAISGLLQYSLAPNSGTFTVTGERLEYTAVVADSFRGLRMNSGTNTAYTTDWTASLTLTNTTTPTSGYSLISLQVIDSNVSAGFFNVGLYRNATNSFVRYEAASASNGFSPAGQNSLETDNQDVLVRISHNSSTKDLTFGYSLDNGLTYKLTYVFNPTSPAIGGSWPAAPSNGYSFRIIALNTTGTVEAGLMFADNFSVTAGATTMVAVPEPSTYAAIAGAAALGLAFWHRRRQARRAS